MRLPLGPSNSGVDSIEAKAGALLALVTILCLMTNFRQLALWICPLIALGSGLLTRQHFGRFWYLLVGLALLSTGAAIGTTGWLPAHYFTSLTLAFSLIYLWLLPNDGFQVGQRTHHTTVEDTKPIRIQWQTLLASFDQWLLPILTVVLVVNNSIGLFEFLSSQLNRNDQYDDAFIGFYGRSGTAMHGLSIINAAVATLYLVSFGHGSSSGWTRTRLLHLALALVLGISSVLCFYGLGLVIWMVMIGLVAVASIRRPAFAGLLVLYGLFMVGISAWSSPKTMAYTVSNINQVTASGKIDDWSDTEENENSGKSAHNDRLARRYQHLPRKVQLFGLYYGHYVGHWRLTLLGSGPGTFCSRVTFLLGGDFSTKKWVNDLRPNAQPAFAEAYVLPLWSSKLTSKPYHDGTRNQPFSSVVAMVAEYGWLFALTLIWISSQLVWRSIKNLNSGAKTTSYTSDQIYIAGIVSISVLLLLHLLVDNLAESSEFLVLLILFKWLMRQTKMAPQDRFLSQA